MNKYLIRVQIIEVHNIEIEAENQEEAVSIAYNMTASEIREKGSIISCETDYAGIIE